VFFGGDYHPELILLAKKRIAAKGMGMCNWGEWTGGNKNRESFGK